MSPEMPDSAAQQEGKILLAIEALNKNQITSIQYVQMHLMSNTLP